jgi:D,D-heptose 1,7-bisphosphate phosphatase
MSNRAVFLDRDNTLIHDPGYISSPEQVHLIDGIGECLKELQDLGFKLVIVTNQSGIARGILSENQLEQVHLKLRRLLADFNVNIDAIYFCPYHPDGTVTQYSVESDLRKPKPGMLFKAAKEMDIDLGGSWLIGDSQRDIEAGKSAGCKTIMVKTPSSVAEIKYKAEDADFVVSNFKEAKNIIKKFYRDNLKKMNSAAAENNTAVVKKDLADNESKDLSAKEEDFNEVKLQIEDIQKTDNKADIKQEQLGEIISLLKSMHRQNMFSEFSGLKLVGVVLQAITILLVVLGLFILVKSGTSSAGVYLTLMFAIVIQMMAAVFLYMSDKS